MIESLTLWETFFGALAVVLNFLGYRQHNLNRYLLISALALGALSFHFFLLGNAEAAGIACGLACVRNIIALKFRGNVILAFFVIANFGFFFYEWFYLQSAWFIVFAYTSSLIFTVGSIVLKSAHRIRLWFILAESLGLIYNMIVGSIFGVIFNLSNLFSIFYTLVAHRKDEKAKQNKQQ